MFDTRTFVRADAVPADTVRRSPTPLTERREQARRRLARAVRRAALARPAQAARLPATAAYGRFTDLTAVDDAAGSLGAEPHAWHRMHLAALAPEGLESELAHLVAVCDRACALYAVRRLGEGLRLSGAQDGLARVRYWLAALSPPARSGQAVRRLRQALPLAAQQGDRERSARILGQLGRLYVSLGGLAEAYTRLRAALDLAAGIDLDPVLHAAMHINFGNVLVHMGHAGRAGPSYQRGLDLALEGRREPVAMLARDCMRYMEEQRGNFAQAYLHGSAVLAWQRQVAAPPVVRRCLVNLARIAHELNPTGDDALSLLAEAEGLDGPPIDLAIQRLCEAVARIAHGEEERAVALIDAVEADLVHLSGAAANTAAFHVAYLRADLLLSRREVSGAYEWYRAAGRILAAYPGRNTDIPPHLRGALVAGMTAAAQAVGRTEEAAGLAAELARAYAPDPLPQTGTREVMREELARTGAEPPDTGAVVFLSARAAPRPRGRR